MKKRYSTWLEEYVYDMTEEQENYLIKNGFIIDKPEEKKHDDNMLRDIPHKIKKDENAHINLVFNAREGIFKIMMNNRNNFVLISVDDVDFIKNKLDEMVKIINELNKLM